MSRLLLRPGWILTHLAVIATAVLFVNLGLWQLDRNAEREAEAGRIEAVQDAAPVPLTEALADPDPFLRPVEVTGTFLPGEGEVRLTPRSRNDLPGLQVLTPFRTDSGDLIIVDRGWVPLDTTPPPAPLGSTTFEGRLAEPRTSRQVLRDDDGTVASLINVDLDVLAEQVEGLRTDAYVEVVDEEARLLGALPRPAEPAQAPGSVNSLSYAVQWFTFAAIGLIGYPLLLRRRIADRRRGTPGDPATEPENSLVSQ